VAAEVTDRQADARLTVVAVFVARPGRETDLERALLALVEPTRAESGCLRYELNRSTRQPGQLFFTEVWASAASHREHLETPHVRAVLAALPDLTAVPLREYFGTVLAS